MVRSLSTLLAACLCMAGCDTLPARDDALPAQSSGRGSVPNDCAMGLLGGRPQLRCLDAPAINNDGGIGGGGNRELRRREETKT